MPRFASKRQNSPQRRRHFFGPLRIWNWSNWWGLVLLLLVGVIRWEVHAAASTTGQPTKHTNDNDPNNHPQNDWLVSWLQNQHSCPTTTKLGLLPSHNNNKDKNEESGPVVVVVALEDIAVNESLVVIAVPSSHQDWMCSSSSSAAALAPLFPASFFTHHELPPPRPVAANRWSRTAHDWILDHVLLSQDGLNPLHFGILVDDDDDEEDDEEEEGLDDDEGLDDEDKEHDHTRNRDAELEETDTSSFMEDHRINARIVTWQYHDDDDEEDEDPHMTTNLETQRSEHPILYQLVATRDIAKGEKLIYNAGDGPFVTPRKEQKEDQESPHDKEDPHPDSTTSSTTTPRVQRTRRQWMVSTGYFHQPHPTRRREMDDRLVWDVHYTVSSDTDNDNNNKNNQDAMSWNETTTTMPKRTTAVQWRSYPPTLAQWNWLQSQYQRLRTDPEIRRHVVPMGVQPSGTATTPPPVDDATGENPSSSSSLVFANPLEHYQFQYYYHSFLQALHAALVSARFLEHHKNGPPLARNKRVVEVTTDRDETQPVDQWLHFYHQFVADRPDNHHTRDLETCTTDDASTTARMNFTHVRLVRRQRLEKNADDESLIHLPSLEEWYDPLEERLDDGLNYDAHKESQECDLPPSPNHPYIRVGTDGEYHHSQLQVDRVSSPYQQLEWRHFVHPPEHYNPLRTTTANASSSFVARDTCLYLDDLFHSCTATRAHVHETMIHYPASFLPQGLKRVLFVGGGDLVILHEILKYPSLELVIGT